MKLWHDEQIFKLCIQYILYEIFISLIWYQVILGQDDELLLSDSGYVAKHIWWLIPTSPKIWDIGRDTTALCRTRVLIEQTYRILKRKFPCFALSLRTDQGRICQYVVASMVLHCFGTPATWHFHTQPWWPYDSRTRHPGHCRSSQPQRLSLQKVHCRAVFRSLNYSCENIYQWQNKHVFIYLYIQN